MRIVVAMSGGVDSSVAAALLAEQGHDVIGLSMQLYDQSEGQTSFGSCCSIDDLHDARRVAAAINIPHYIVNFEKQFDEQVIANFVSEYAAGRTPLPCAHCNSDLKFATLADRARGLRRRRGRHRPLRARRARRRRPPRAAARRRRRQGPVLFPVLADAGAAGVRASSPVGDLPKDEVRAYARRRRLPVADKPDSQEICFIPDHDYRAFVTKSVPEAAREGRVRRRAGPRARQPRRHPPLHRRPAQGAGPVVADRRADVCARAAARRISRSSSARRRRWSRRG